MIRKLITIGVLGLVLAAAACSPDKAPRNPDDRKTDAGIEFPAS